MRANTHGRYDKTSPAFLCQLWIQYPFTPNPITKAIAIGCLSSLLPIGTSLAQSTAWEQSEGIWHASENWNNGVPNINTTARFKPQSGLLSVQQDFKVAMFRDISSTAYAQAVRISDWPGLAGIVYDTNVEVSGIDGAINGQTPFWVIGDGVRGVNASGHGLSITANETSILDSGNASLKVHNVDIMTDRVQLSGTEENNASFQFSGAQLEIDDAISLNHAQFLLLDDSHLIGTLQGASVNVDADSIFSVIAGQSRIENMSVDLTAGTVIVSAGSTLEADQFSGLGTIQINGVLDLTGDEGQDTGFSKVFGLNATHFQGLGQLRKSGTSTLDLSNVATNTLLGGSSFTAGTIITNHGDKFGADGTTLELSNITLQASDSFTVANSPTTLSGSNVIDTQSHTISWHNSISGSGGLTKIGSGDLYLKANNTYSGNTFVQQGGLIIHNFGSSPTGSATGSGNVFVVANAYLGGYGSIDGVVQLLAGAEFNPDMHASDLDLDQMVTGTHDFKLGSLVVSDGASVIIDLYKSGSANAPQYAIDRLLIDGSATILGELKLDEAISQIAALPLELFGQSFVFMQVTGRFTGEFEYTPTMVDYTMPGGHVFQAYWEVGYTENTAYLTLVPEPGLGSFALVGTCFVLTKRRHRACFQS